MTAPLHQDKRAQHAILLSHIGHFAQSQAPSKIPRFALFDICSAALYIEPMARDYREWLKQAEYDMETADLMFSGGRFFYTVFMCHLAIEKALKGLYQKKFQKMPEKTHNLIFFLEQLQISPPEPVGKFIVRLNEASVATRYPESLAIISKNYSKKIAGDIISESREALIWIKRQY